MSDITPEKFIDLARQAKDNKRLSMVLFQDADGNWRGCITKDGKVLFVRDVGPETVLQRLLTHDGQ